MEEKIQTYNYKEQIHCKKCKCNTLHILNSEKSLKDLREYPPVFIYNCAVCNTLTEIPITQILRKIKLMCKKCNDEKEFIFKGVIPKNQKEYLVLYNCSKCSDTKMGVKLIFI